MTLTLAMIIDALFGEPKWLWDRVPHPAVLMGRVIEWTDTRLNTGNNRRQKGAFTIAVLLVLSAVAGGLISELPFPVEILVVAILLAQRSLVDHVQDVADGLRIGLGDGRLAVAKIVGRDVSEMEASGVARSAIESAAENLSDGVVAPIFWYLLAGLPGLIAYKMLNTADSMIGYRTDRHEEFGWAAARLDDLANWLPARLTAGAIWLASGASTSWRRIADEARQHRSPNAGWPEAAMAYGLNLAISGPRKYDGHVLDYPFINPDGQREIGANEIEKTVGILWRVWGICLLAALLFG